jgi:hypothetical protein
MTADHPLPYRLKHLPKDRRGLPIPFVVFRDQDGKPHFTINDQHAVAMALSSKLCGLCGKPHRFGEMWFIGGPTAAFHESGAFIDPPVHRECGEYAMKVCPFIAAPSWSRRIDDKTLDYSKLPQDQAIVAIDSPPERPPYFVMARASGYRIAEADDSPGQALIVPRRPWKETHFWLNSHEITKTYAKEISARTDFPAEKLEFWPK